MTDNTKATADTSAATTEATPTAAAPTNTVAASDLSSAPDKTVIVPSTEPATAAAPVTTTTETASAPAVPAEETTTETKKVAAEIEPINNGMIGYTKDPLVDYVTRSIFHLPSKHFWLGKESVTTQNLSHYIQREKKSEISHPVTAWASQTGKGLLFSGEPGQTTQPYHVFNLSDATDLVKEGPQRFHFKLHGHKHVFEKTTARERDGWFLSIEEAMKEGKAIRENILGSEGYKQSIHKLDKRAIDENATAKGQTAAKTSTDVRPSGDLVRTGGRTEEATSDSEKKIKRKNRSASRGKRTSIFGAILGNREVHEKKDETAVPEPVSSEAKGKEKAVEPAEETQEVPVVAAPEVTASAPTAFTSETTSTEAAKTENLPATTIEKTEETIKPSPNAAALPAKPSKRASLFGQFFDRVRTPAHEKKEHEVVPIVSTDAAAGDGEAVKSPKADPATVPEATSTPAGTVLPTTEPTTTKSEVVDKKKVDDGPPKKEEKENLLGKFLNRDRSKSPAAEARSEKKDVAVPAASSTEPSAVPVDSTVAPSAETSAAPVAATPDPVKEKRRTSFFGNFGSSARKEKKPMEVNTEGGDKLTSENKPNSPIPRLGSLFRKPSQGIKTSKDTKADKEVIEPIPKLEETAKVTDRDEKPATLVETPAAASKNDASSTKPTVESAKVAEDMKKSDTPTDTTTT